MSLSALEMNSVVLEAAQVGFAALAGAEGRICGDSRTFDGNT